MINFKLTTATFLTCSFLTSNFIFAMPTYSDDYIDTSEIEWGDFTFFIPSNWEEFGSEDESYRGFAIFNDINEMCGYLAIVRQEANYSDFEYPASMVESGLSEAFAWSDPTKFKKYPILGDTEFAYFATSKQTIDGDLLDCYALSFPYNGFGYCLSVNIYPNADIDYSFDIAHIFNSIRYKDNDISEIFEDDISYGPGQYKVGVDIPASEYYIVAQYDGVDGYFSVSSDSNGDKIIINDIFSVNSIVSVNDGEYLTLADASAISVPLFNGAKAIDYSLYTSGTLKVGCDIQPGEYKLTATSNKSGYWAIYSDARHNIVSNNIFDTSCYVTLSDGQYFNYIDCTISQ